MRFLGQGTFVCYIRYFVRSVVKKERRTEHIEFTGMEEKGLLYQIFLCEVSTIHKIVKINDLIVHMFL